MSIDPKAVSQQGEQEEGRMVRLDGGGLGEVQSSKRNIGGWSN